MTSIVTHHKQVHTRYERLACQVSYMRWIVPPCLALFVFGFEFYEHTIMHQTPFAWDFFLELLLFGIVGPMLIGGVLTWIVHNLRELQVLHQAMNHLNDDLERKVHERTEALHQANQELLELDHLKSEFVALVSHELRAPLTNIQGGLELVLTDEKHVTPDVRDNLTIIQCEVSRLIRLVKRILDVSVLESGQLSLNMGLIALRPLLQDVVTKTHLPSISYRLKLDLLRSIPLVIADEERLIDIMANLLQNAVKYSPDGGEICVSVRADEDHVYISVRDEGIGIEPNDIPYLAEKFYRSDITNHSNGYGLGLYFVEQLIEAQGGTLIRAIAPE